MKLIVNKIRVYRISGDLQRRELPDFQPWILNPIPFIDFGKAEPEIVAQDLLNLSISARQWVGMSWKDYALLQQGRWRDRVRKFVPKAFGFMTRFPIVSEHELNVPIHTLLFGRKGAETSTIGGFPISQIVGVRMLMEDGMVYISHESEEDVIIPSNKLIYKALELKREEMKIKGLPFYW